MRVAQEIVNALSLGATYALLALGLAMVLNILGLVNFAHGELLTVAAYAMYAGYQLELPFLVMVVMGVVAAAATGVAMERIAFRPLRGASFATLLFSSFAVSVIITSLLRGFVSPRQKALPFPELFDRSFEIAGVTIGWLQIITMAVTAIALVLLTLFLRRTNLGLGMLAAAQDFQVARLVGVRANRVIAAAFAMSGVLAALAAVSIVARRGTVDPGMGFQPVIAALIGTVVGGLGSLTGAVVGGFVLGALEITFDASLPDGLQPYSAAFALTLVIAILYFRPRGLLEASSEER
jgi:branched-chain amino acid transport system permease protein